MENLRISQRIGKITKNTCKASKVGCPILRETSHYRIGTMILRIIDVRMTRGLSRLQYESLLRANVRSFVKSRFELLFWGPTMMGISRFFIPKLRTIILSAASIPLLEAKRLVM